MTTPWLLLMFAKVRTGVVNYHYCTDVLEFYVQARIDKRNSTHLYFGKTFCENGSSSEFIFVGRRRCWLLKEILQLTEFYAEHLHFLLTE